MCLSIEALSAYLDGDIAAEDRSRVDEHLASCAKCRSARDELAVMKSLAREAQFSPPPLWPAIAAGLEGRSWFDRWFRSPWVAASVAAAAVSLFFLLIWPRVAPHASELSAARHSYSEAITRLEAANRSTASRLPDEARIKIEESLALVDRAIAACEEELAAHPGDPLGEKMLLSLYDEKVRVLDAALAAADRGVVR